jgi:hypothetical protein
MITIDKLGHYYSEKTIEGKCYVFIILRATHCITNIKKPTIPVWPLFTA